jgi:glutamate racemase
MSHKIGVLDSGIGGLTILGDLINQNYNAKYFYISDSNNVPWGEKSQEFMYDRIRIMVTKLLHYQVQAILLACNTATAETIDKIRAEFPTITFIGIEPYLNYINHFKQQSQNKYALILTQATFKSARFQKLRETLDPAHHVDIYPLANLAMLIESLKTESFTAIKNKVSQEISILKNKGYTHLILGCTHYPIIRDYLEKELNLITINPSLRIVDHLKQVLKLDFITNAEKEFLYNENCGDIWLLKTIEDFSFLNTKFTLSD